jgi:hypothetical protein
MSPSVFTFDPEFKLSGEMPTFTITSSTSPQTLALLRALLSSGAITTALTETPSGVLPSEAHPDVQALLNAIPIAHEGDVITAEYHNSVVDLLRVVARLLGDPALARFVTVNVPPAFLPYLNRRPWKLGAGQAARPDPTEQEVEDGIETITAAGWTPAQLPHGSQIQRMTVTGTRAGVIQAGCVIRLQRVASETGQTLSLAEVDITEEDGDFQKSATVSAEDLTPSELTARRRVDTDRFSYVVLADLEEAELDAEATIKSIRVECARRQGGRDGSRSELQWRSSNLVAGRQSLVDEPGRRAELAGIRRDRPDRGAGRGGSRRPQQGQGAGPSQGPGL